MDLYIDRDELIRGLARVQGVVERRSTNLALSHVLLNARDKALRMTATDTSIALIGDCAARVNEEGELSVDAQSFFQIARSLTDPVVHLKSIPGNRLELRCGKAEFTVVGMAAEDFPPLPARDDQGGLSISGQDLRRMIDETLFAISADDNRYGLNGAHLEEITNEAGEPRLRMVTTDGSRLSWSETAFDGSFGMGRRMLLPRKALNEIRKVCDTSEEKWQLSFGERSATFSTEGMLLMIRLIDGEFPDYRQVLPPSYKRRVIIERANFHYALKRVAIVASDRNNSVRFELEGDQLILSAENIDLGNAREILTVEAEGESMETGFNVRYFLDLLSSTKGDQLILEIGDPLDPCIVRIPGRDDCLFVVMPMRLD